jgi:replicative DNA helicase
MEKQVNLISTNEINEKIVLGVLAAHNPTLENYFLRLKSDYFELKVHQQIYDVMLELFKSNNPIDVIIIKNCLYDIWNDTNWNEILADISNFETYHSQIDFFVRALQENYINKQLATTALVMGNQATDKTERINAAIMQLMELKKLISSAEGKSISKLIDLFNESKGLFEEDLLVKTGLVALDEKLNGGFEQKQMIIIGARPGVGKSALLMNIFNQILLEKKKKVLFVSFMMNPKRFLALLLSNKIKAPFNQIVKDFTPSNYKEDCKEITAAEESGMFKYHFQKDNDIVSLLAEISSQKIKNGLDVVIIDSLQQLEDLNPIFYQNRNTSLGKNLRRLKQLAQEMNLLIIIGSELSRNTEKRGSGRPVLSDLKDSGWIEELADKVLLIYRPECYNFTEWDDGTPAYKEADIDVSKNKLGQTGNVRVCYDSETFAFSDHKYGYVHAQEGMHIPTTRMDEF